MGHLFFEFVSRFSPQIYIIAFLGNSLLNASQSIPWLIVFTSKIISLKRVFHRSSRFSYLYFKQALIHPPERETISVASMEHHRPLNFCEFVVSHDFRCYMRHLLTIIYDLGPMFIILFAISLHTIWLGYRFPSFLCSCIIMLVYATAY